MCTMVARIVVPSARSARSSRALAAARDSVEPSGKSPGCDPPSVAGRRPRLSFRFSQLRIVVAVLGGTGSMRHTNRLLEPLRQCAVFSVGFQLVFRHALKHLVQV